MYSLQETGRIFLHFRIAGFRRSVSPRYVEGGAGGGGGVSNGVILGSQEDSCCEVRFDQSVIVIPLVWITTSYPR